MSLSSKRLRLGASWHTLPQSGPVFWLKADDIHAVNPGDYISTWPDSSGANNHATNTNQAEQPIYIINAVSSLPAVRFNGAQALFSNASSSYARQTVIAVIKPSVNTGMQTIRGGGPSGQSGGLQIRLSGGKPSMVHELVESVADGTKTASLTQFQVVSYRFDSAINYALNVGTQVDTAGNTAATLTAGCTTTIGRNGGWANEYFSGDIAEIKCWNRILTDTELQTEITQLQTKWQALYPDTIIPPLVTDYSAWTQPVHEDVRPIAYESALPAGGTAWPAFPMPSVPVEFDNPRSGQHESYLFVDPTIITPPGPVTYSGYPRGGAGSFALQAIDPNTQQPATVTLAGNKFIWVDDILTDGSGTYRLLDGLDLRRLLWRADVIAKSRGEWGILVLAKDKIHYAPDFTDGFYDGVRIGSNGTNTSSGQAPASVQISGIIGQGPTSVVAMRPGGWPTGTVAAMMSKDAALDSLNYCSWLTADGVPERVWLANFTCNFTPITDNNGNDLFWNGMRIANNTYGSVVERIGSRGFAPGYSSLPPGESFTISTLKSDDVWIRDCWLDGGSLDNVRRSTSMLATNISARVRQERNRIQYGLSGMNTWWNSTDALSVFDESYTSSIGGTIPANGGTITRSGSGLNLEETRGKIRVFFRRNSIIGRYSSETTNPDKSDNGGLWMSLASTQYDSAADTVIWEPRWPMHDYDGLYGTLTITESRVYAGQTTAVVSQPQILYGGQWLVGKDNYTLSGTFIDPSPISANTNYLNAR